MRSSTPASVITGPVVVNRAGPVVWGLLALGSSYRLVREQHPVIASLILAGPVLLLVWSGLV